MTSRRRFLEASGTLAAAAALGGCADVTAWRALWAPEAGGGGFAPPASSEIDEVSHIIARLTYGARPGDHARVRALAAREDEAVARFIEEQLAPGDDDPRADRAVRRLEALAEPVGELYEYQPALLREQLADATLRRAVHAHRQLHAVMTEVWADHFNIDISKGDCRWLTPAFARDVLRPHALGTFPALLRAVVLSPAMLWYLDGRVNRRATPAERPNENYARELLELHALGVHGGYTQDDVMEVARALTGWTVRSRGESRFGIGRVEFHADAHDDGAKLVLGQRIAAGGGARDVDDVLHIVVAHPACSRFIATRLCRRFIADTPPASAVDAVARTFAATGGDIRATLRTLFATPEFRAARGARLKRPFHFVVSALRATDASTEGGRPLVAWLERLGQVPFQYPTPDGYPDAADPWLGTLLWRWQFARALVAGRIEGTRVDPARLARRAGGERELLAHLLGRRPTEQELAAARASGQPVALALSAPAFQLT